MGSGTHSRMGGSIGNTQRHWKSKFNGRGNTSLRLYLRQFELVSNCNGWDSSEKALQLVSSLEGAALDALERVQGTLTYLGVVDALQLCFPDYECASSFQNAFDTASRKPGEHAGPFATRLGDLAYKAYPDVPGCSLASLVLRRFIMAQPCELKNQITLVNPTNIKDAVQLINRLDGLAMDRMSAVASTAMPRQMPLTANTLADALHGMGLDCASDDQSEDPQDEDPQELISALAQMGAHEMAECLATSFAKSPQSAPFKCFFCRDSGHAWLRCTKLWDLLKKNGFKPRSGTKPFQRHNNASMGNQKTSTPSGLPHPSPPP